MASVNDYYVFAGSYSSAAEEGIHLFRFDARQGTLQRLGGVSGVENPSFLAADLNRNRLYAVSETDHGGAIVCLRVDPLAGKMEEINRQPSYGNYPCHVTIDHSGKWLLLVNYMSGSVCVYPLRADGALDPLSQQVQHTGSGLRQDRQDGPHPHAIFPVPFTDYYLVPDLGADTVYTYRLDRDHGELILQREVKTQPGHGPRHLAFHPKQPVVYLIEELSSTITVYSVDRSAGSLAPLQTVPTLPDDFAGESTCAEVAVSRSGKYVYGSNRGHDSIAVFRTESDGRLNRVGIVSSGGLTPRNFAIVPDDSFLLCANQDSNSIVVMKLQPDGTPAATGEIFLIQKPVCLRIIPAGHA